MAYLILICLALNISRIPGHEFFLAMLIGGIFSLLLYVLVVKDSGRFTFFFCMSTALFMLSGSVSAVLGTGC